MASTVAGLSAAGRNVAHTTIKGPGRDLILSNRISLAASGVRKKGVNVTRKTARQSSKVCIPRAAVTTSDPKTWSSNSSSSSTPKFQWEKHWYPVSLIEDLDSTRPTPFQLLGKDIVIWKDTQGLWRVHADKCPHRLAPLSEGRINDEGLLECPYHGWSFRGDGSCARIPQASEDGVESRAVYSPKACVESFPAIVSQGLLFVWPEAGRWEEALAVKPPELPAEFSDPSFSTVTIQRDLYYGYDTLMENVSDPSHIDFAHHAVTGRRDRAKPLPFTIQTSGPEGFEAMANTEPAIFTSFQAPTALFSRLDLHPVLPLVGRRDWQLWICSFNVPMAPGRTRSIVCSARNFARFSVPGDKWWQMYPRWLEHLTSNKIYDGDMIVLQGQEKSFSQEREKLMLLSRSKQSSQQADSSGNNRTVIHQAENPSDEVEDGADVAAAPDWLSGGHEPISYGKLTFTPAGADRMVLEFRNWLRKYAGGGPAWDSAVSAAAASAPLPSTYLSRRDMLDRMSQHTEKCSSCRAAYRNVRRATVVLLALGVITLGLAVVPTDVTARVVIVAVAVVMFGVAGYLKLRLEKQFEFVDYVIADVK